MTKKKLLIVVGAVLGVFLIGFMFYTMNKGNNHPQFQLEDGKTGTLKSEAKASSEKNYHQTQKKQQRRHLNNLTKKSSHIKTRLRKSLKS